MEIYCINPQCKQRKNPNNVFSCLDCGSNLQIIGKKSTYKLIKPLRDLDPDLNAEIFKVEDTKERKYKVLKILNKNLPKYIELFRQEQELFFRLEHKGIPKAYDSFSISLRDQKIECLVMEWIDGQNLQDLVETKGPIDNDTAIEWLHQILRIIDYIHQNNFIHRDIKPSNIMCRQNGQLVLIDFGTSRQVTQSVVDGHAVTKVSSQGYTSDEQKNGQAKPQSDIYALGRTFVYLLTGQDPDNFLTGQELLLEKWQKKVLRSVDPKLLFLINEMMNRKWEKRPSNATAIKQISNLSSQLKKTKANESKPMLKFSRKQKIFSFFALISMILLVFFALLLNKNTIITACDDKSDFLSCGEEFLTQDFRTNNMNYARRAWINKNFNDAADFFGKSKNNPEALIYANNAAINNSKFKVYTIAVAVPLQGVPGKGEEDKSDVIGLEILRGVAQAQDEFNKKKSAFRIRVLIADDWNQVEQAQEIAKSLVQKTEILAVIGHYASDITKEVLPIYKSANSTEAMVLLSSTSTAANLNKNTVRENNFFFRTAPTTETEANALVYFLKHEDSKAHVNVAIFSNNSPYSKSLKELFQKSFESDGKGDISSSLDLSEENFDPQKKIDQVIEKGATALAIFPDGHTSSNAFRNAIQLIKANQGRLRIIGGNSLYSPDTLAKVGAEASKSLVVVVPWQIDDDHEQSAYVKSAKKLWYGANWRSATSYDAVKVLITALEQVQKNTNPTRQSLQKVLSNPDFIVKEGTATGTINFEEGNRGDTIKVLVKVVPTQNCKDPYRFIPRRHRFAKENLYVCNDNSRNEQ